MDIKILVATHKKYAMPQEKIYIPLHVGKESKEKLDYQGDNTGDNISIKNANYCELTGLYWAWKNLKCDYIGLCHYRRYFTNKNLFIRVLKKNSKFDLILKKIEIENLFKKYDIILPRKRNYYIETIKSHYEHAHNIRDLEETRKIIEQKYPEYLKSFDAVMKRRTLYLFNMFIMKKEQFDNYCKWVFDILFELEKRIDISHYNNYQKRVFGFLSERLFNVWLEYNCNFIKKQIRVINLEKTNWYNKINDFILRKINFTSKL
ncbi:DUF4422 domain-containing protein [Clostridium sp. SYSU_GA19001]|uniref:DUF4422 domain-containing protein n=1 Tax=Clostridium caldaquaticum TaxID=2940653 RepID=UPI0020773077|nr:DUF4422 domain-containing protein [Clostridium caldaquaticum]MCM8711375.1 DUF4422 domain-containing protein [Clostridium caldaquaticum]